MSRLLPERDRERIGWFVRRVLIDEIMRAETLADAERAAEGIESVRRIEDAWAKEYARHHAPPGGSVPAPQEPQ